ncbi:MAG: hypothetical protein QOF84_7537 [Streptomyces sp.]|nr:hypothetical protein [Streptomyces sp.]
MSHRNARLTVHGRRLLVERVSSGRPVAHVAAEPNSGTPHPDDVHTLAELAAALQVLRGSRSYRDLMLPRSTLSDVLNGKSMPSQETMDAFLTACEVDTSTHEAWLTAWERVSTAHLHKPVGAVRVREAQPRLLGVHASIQVDSGVSTLPTYIPRDLDEPYGGGDARATAPARKPWVLTSSYRRRVTLSIFSTAGTMPTRKF